MPMRGALILKPPSVRWQLARALLGSFFLLQQTCHIKPLVLEILCFESKLTQQTDSKTIFVPK